MELQLLRYFHAIARHGSMGKAAKALRVSQPSLTVAMRNLEEELGTTLLVRDHQGVSLTATGKELLASTEEVFTLLDVARQRIHGMQTDEGGRFVLGCHESLGAYFLPGFLRHVAARAPRLELSLWNGTSRAVTDAVINRDVHFGLAVNAQPHEDLVIVPLFHDAMDVVVASSLVPAPLDEAGARALLRDGQVIYASRVTQCQEVLEQLGRMDVLPKRQLACGDLELVKSLTLAGLGVGLLPRRVAEYGQHGKMRCLHPSMPFVPDVIHLLYRGDLHRTRGATLLKDELTMFGRGLDPHVF